MVTSRLFAISFGVAALATSVLQITQAPPAEAQPCPDAEVVFARGTTEAPGVGPTGEAFVEALRARTVGKSLGVYAVDYPATIDFPTAVDGINDARSHILATAANCPKTKMVLGGFSQGAAVIGFVTANVVPEGVSPADVPAPMPPEVASHISAVALFGKPSTRFMRAINDPAVTVGPQYVGKTIELCVDNDLVCDTSGRSFSAHNTYIDGGMVDQGATFAASQLQASWAADAAAQPSVTGPVPGPEATPAPSPLSAPAAPVTPPLAGAGIPDPTPHLPTGPVPPGPPSAPAAPPAPDAPII
ncbi:cutinase family protein [Mycobacterium sp. NPDC048908]|uniref:cutinase family protein n=1 Tax=Mycobacterium sp. NPDC048908 TaxID=3364292 RepID=UPI00371BAF6F